MHGQSMALGQPHMYRTEELLTYPTIFASLFGNLLRHFCPFETQVLRKWKVITKDIATRNLSQN